MAFPEDHPQWQEDSLARRALASLASTLVHNAHAYGAWRGSIFPATSQLSAPLAISQMITTMRQGRGHDRHLYVLATDGSDVTSWLYDLLKEWPEPAGLAILFTNEQAFAYCHSVVIAAERIGVTFLTCSALVQDNRVAVATLNQLAEATR